MPHTTKWKGEGSGLSWEASEVGPDRMFAVGRGRARVRRRQPVEVTFTHPTGGTVRRVLVVQAVGTCRGEVEAVAAG